MDDSYYAACPGCPFRTGALFGYDKYAMSALNDGLAPSCHMLAGMTQFSLTLARWLTDAVGMRHGSRGRLALVILLRASDLPCRTSNRPHMLRLGAIEGHPSAILPRRVVS